MKVHSTLLRYAKYLILSYTFTILIFACVVYLLSAYYNIDYQDIGWATMSSFKLSLGAGFAKNYILLSE